VATFTRLKSGSWRSRSWRVQVRRKGKYVNDTFLRRKDAEEWARDVERILTCDLPFGGHAAGRVIMRGAPAAGDITEPD
jgi:hypothetical protein